MSKTAILGACTAYGIARKYGYTGTEEEWNALQNSLKEEAKTYATNAAESATAAATSEKNAATSEANAKSYMDSAEAYKNSAFSATPEGYESNMQKLADMDIQTATGESLCISDTCAGGIKINSIKGKSVQDGEPTPDAPVEIESVGDSGSVKIKSCGKNLLNNISLFKTTTDNGTWNGNVFTYKNGTVLTLNDDGSFHIKGSFINTNWLIPIKDLTVEQWGLIENKPYLFGCEVKGTFNNSVYLYNRATNSTVIYAYRDGVPSEDNYKNSFVFDGSSTYNLSISAQGDVDATFYLMIVDVNTKDFAYEPYKSTEITIPLTEPLRSIGDVKDEIVMQDGKWGVLRRIGKVDLGELTWIKSSGSDNRFYSTSLNSLLKYGDAKYQNLRSTKYINSFSNDNGFMYNSDKRVVVNDTAHTDASEFKTAVKGTTLIYEFATPTFEPFTDQTPFYGLSSFDGVTNIITDQTIEPTMELEYGKSMVGAYTLENHNTSKKNEAVLTDLQTAYLTTLAQEV